MNIDKEYFGTTREGDRASSYLMTNENGMEVEVSDFGALLLAIRVPDKKGQKTDILLGYDTMEEYYDNSCGFGAYVGRNANRIGGACVVLDGKEYLLEANSHGNNLHSGSNRSHYQFYRAITGSDEQSVWVELSRISPDLEQGFPGNLMQKIRYTLTDRNELHIDYNFVSDQTTVINPTNHSYFNLAGQGNGDVLTHEMQIFSDAFLLTDEHLLPTGEIAQVDGTPMDFRSVRKVGERIDEDYRPLQLAGGYDHNYIFPSDGKLRKAAWIRSGESGITMTVFTDMCGMQVYTANFLNHKKGKGGILYERRDGICFETQFYPNSCKNPAFPSCIFNAGQHFISRTSYQFETETT